MVGGDAAARHPVQAAAGFLEQLDEVPDFTRAPFNFPTRYGQATTLLHAGVRVAASTSMGRLFDTIAALLGFTRPTTFEGQAAIWLEHLAAEATGADVCPFPFHGASSTSAFCWKMSSHAGWRASGPRTLLERHRSASRMAFTVR